MEQVCQGWSVKRFEQSNGPDTVVMEQVCQGWSVKRFEQSNGPDTVVMEHVCQGWSVNINTPIGVLGMSPPKY